MLTERDVEHAVEQVLNRRDRLDRPTHDSHHRWVEQQIGREKRRQEARQRLKNHVLQSAFGAFAIATVGAAGALLVGVGKRLFELLSR